MHALGRLPVFFVIFLIVLLPVSFASQVAAAAGQGYLPAQQDTEVADVVPEGDFSALAVCTWPKRDCAGSCWAPCSSGSTWYCGATKAVCCSSDAKYCADKCWTPCSSSYIWVCGENGAVCKPRSTCSDSRYPYPCGTGCWSGCGSGYRFECVSGQGQCKLETCTDSGYPYYCGNGCWSCSGVFNCDSGTGKCCPNSNPYYCSRTGECWSADWVCDKAIQCGGTWQACGSSSDTAYCSGSSVVCCPSDKPYFWNNGCQKCPSDKPKQCGGNCYSGSECGDANYPNWSCKPDGSVTCCANGFPYYCSKTDNAGQTACWRESWMCDKAIDCNGWKVCGSGSEVPYCNSGSIVCCPSDKPNYVNGECRKCTGEFPNECGGKCWSNCGDPAYPAWNCKPDGTAACCPSDYPYFCPKTGDRCTPSLDICNKVQKCGSEWSYCANSDFPNWFCTGNSKSGCCHKDYPYWWDSDGQCHSSPYSPPPPCPVPNGASASCDCDSDSDCPSGSPYCGEGGSLYDIRTSQGFHACLATKPKYCGDGSCEGSETYGNCAADCASSAPKGAIDTDVVYHSGSLKGKPIQGAHVYLDDSLKGNTDKDGKISFEAGYGRRTVKVECPDSSFCDSKTISVDGAEYNNVRCTCNPPSDSDRDGYGDNDETLLGTDPKNANSNFGTTFAEDSVDLLACLPTPATLLIIWKETVKKDGNIIQANSLVIGALNVTSVTSASLAEKPYAVASAIAAAGLPAKILAGTNATLESAVKSAEYVDGIYTQNELLLVATDRETGTTAIIVVGAGCVGAFSGALYGIGQGVVDDVKGVVEGIWFVITHVAEIGKVIDSAKELVNGVIDAFRNLDELFRTMFRGILEKGKSINIFREGRLNNPEAYRRAQVGFFYGFVAGYITEQVALGAVIFSKVAKFFKLGQLFGKVGKAAKLTEKLALIRSAEDFGAEIAEKLSKLKYFKEGIETWLDSEVKGLARIVKHNEGWAKGLGEAEAKVAAKHADSLAAAGKVTDAAFGDLLKTKLGRGTLKAADATDDLLAKQSKLIQKWGAKKADDVISKCFLGICYGDRIDDFNRILKAMPEGIADDLNPERAVKLLGNKDVVKGAEALATSIDKSTLAKFANSADDFEDMANAAGKISDRYGSLDNFYPALKSCLGVTGITSAAFCSPADIKKITDDLKVLGHDVGKLEAKFGKLAVERTFDAVKSGAADLSKISPESVAKIMKGYGKVNPFDLGEQKLVKILKAPGKQTVIGAEKVDNVFVLRKGKMVAKENKELWGVDHIKDKHSKKFNEVFGKTLDDTDIETIAEKVIDDAAPPTPVRSTDPGIKEAVEKEIEYNGKKAKVRVAYLIKAKYGAMPGDIATVFIP
ncbi:hypothetical protein HYU17_01470 [Candidatus Woesearchaeota archaeon]|nr:hypothetical protein [Candidatus Woesearchaeota archaeon]